MSALDLWPLTQKNGLVLNRIQALVLAFFVLTWIGLVAILLAAPDVYDQSLKLSGKARPAGETLFVVALSAFIALLSYGVVRRWRWLFWLILVAFLAGVLRAPASVLELTGTLATTGPTWYVLFQGGLGIVQFAIGLTMVAGYRRAGTWGDP